MRRLPLATLTLLLAGCHSSVSLEGLQFGSGYTVQDVAQSPDIDAGSEEDAWWRNNFDAALYCDAGSCGGACTNADDQGAASSQLAVKTKLMNAMQSCLAGGNYGAQCVTDTMTYGSEPFFSSACSGCFGGYYSCGIGSCAGSCMAGTSQPACAECFQVNCSPGFAACSGWVVSW